MVAPFLSPSSPVIIAPEGELQYLEMRWQLWRESPTLNLFLLRVASTSGRAEYGRWVGTQIAIACGGVRRGPACRRLWQRRTRQGFVRERQHRFRGDLRRKPFGRGELFGFRISRREPALQRTMYGLSRLQMRRHSELGEYGFGSVRGLRAERGLCGPVLSTTDVRSSTRPSVYSPNPARVFYSDFVSTRRFRRNPLPLGRYSVDDMSISPPSVSPESPGIYCVS